MKKLKFILMLLLTLPLLGQGQTTWTGTVSRDWDDVSNWSAGLPNSGTDVTISSTAYSPVIKGSPLLPAECRNLTIVSPAVLTIIAGTALTVHGDLVNGSAKGIEIKSDANGTGSMIVYGTSTGAGTIFAERYMTNTGWHMVSSPLSGQSVTLFLGNNITIPKNSSNLRGMMDYDPAANAWNTFFNGTSGKFLGGGKGFCMRVTLNSAVEFIGSLQVGDQSAVDMSADNWNCIGNPYTSALHINQNSQTTNNFLTLNGITNSNIDPLYGIYIWEKPDANNGQSGQYTAISNASAAYKVQQGQAFFVKMIAGKTSVSFTSAMQTHLPELTLKSTEKVWPTIKLLASASNLKSSTVIAFNSGMTKGLDPTYDAGLFKGGADLAIYSRLVEDYGIPFAIQALPDNDYKSLVIPIGVDSKTGGEVVFSAELLNLPADCKVILEDKVTKSFTDLSKENYNVTVAANSVIADRFQLHTSDLISKLGTGILAGTLNAYAIPKTEIRVVGEVSNNAVASLYNVQGGVVLIQNLAPGNLNVIPTSNIKTGIYMLSIEDHGKTKTFKLLIRE